MPELRVVVPKGLDELLDKVVDAGLFATKADAIRAATIYFLKDLGWLEKPRKVTEKRRA
jgi:Arc/MetJ-type ribon-helix-helix transcriptional regulator